MIGILDCLNKFNALRFRSFEDLVDSQNKATTANNPSLYAEIALL